MACNYDRHSGRYVQCDGRTRCLCGGDTANSDFTDDQEALGEAVGRKLVEPADCPDCTRTRYCDACVAGFKEKGFEVVQPSERQIVEHISKVHYALELYFAGVKS